MRPARQSVKNTAHAGLDRRLRENFIDVNESAGDGMMDGVRYPMGEGASFHKICRGDRIRTCDPLLPKQVLYQAELLPVIH